MFHTTQWDHSIDPADKRIAVIGTGSTGTQLMPALAQKAKQLTVYQRTPSWITPVKGYHDKVPPEVHWLMDNMPGYWNWFVYQHHVSEVQLQNFQTLDHEWRSRTGGVNKRNDQLRESLTSYIRQKVGDRDDLFEKLVPNYAPTARRLVIDNGFYDALLQDNVELDTTGIDKITTHGIKSKDGAERAFDLIVLSAGFQVSRFLWPVQYLGREGTTLEDLWAKDGARAHLGVTLPDFPNFFMLYGPNSQARAGGFHSWIEAVVRYVCGLIVATIEQDGTRIELRRDVYNTYNSELDQAMKETIWQTEGKGGYYVNPYGRPDLMMPWQMYQFYNRLSERDSERNFVIS